jgi:hypothetical protein
LPRTENTDLHGDNIAGTGAGNGEQEERGRRKEEGGKRKEERGRRKEEGGKRKEEGNRTHPL